MARRVLTDKQRGWLERELKRWLEDGLLTRDAADRILAQYETTDETTTRKRSIFLHALVTVAVLLFFLALLLLIGYNWDGLGRAPKLLIIFGVVAGIHGAAVYLRFQRGAVRLADAAFLLGCLAYGAGIWLVAQVFHLDAHYPDAFFWWALGVLPFALLLDTVLLHLLLVALLAVWAGTEVFEFPGLGHLLFGGRWFIPNGAYLLPVLAFPGIAWSYRKGSPIGVGYYALLIAWWLVLQAFAWGRYEPAIYLVGGVGAVYLMVAQLHRPGSSMGRPYRDLGVTMFAGVLIPLSFRDYYDFTHGESSWVEGGMFNIIVIITLVLVVTLVARFRPRRAEEPADLPRRWAALLRAQVLPISLALLMAARQKRESRRPHGVRDPRARGRRQALARHEGEPAQAVRRQVHQGPRVPRRRAAALWDRGFLCQGRDRPGVREQDPHEPAQRGSGSGTVGAGAAPQAGDRVMARRARDRGCPHPPGAVAR